MRRSANTRASSASPPCACALAENIGAVAAAPTRPAPTRRKSRRELLSSPLVSAAKLSAADLLGSLSWSCMLASLPATLVIRSAEGRSLCRLRQDRLGPSQSESTGGPDRAIG